MLVDGIKIENFEKLREGAGRGARDIGFGGSLSVGGLSLKTPKT